MSGRNIADALEAEGYLLSDYQRDMCDAAETQGKGTPPKATQKLADTLNVWGLEGPPTPRPMGGGWRYELGRECDALVDSVMPAPTRVWRAGPQFLTGTRTDPVAIEMARYARLSKAVERGPDPGVWLLSKRVMDYLNSDRVVALLDDIESCGSQPQGAPPTPRNCPGSQPKRPSTPAGLASGRAGVGLTRHRAHRKRRRQIATQSRRRNRGGAR